MKQLRLLHIGTSDVPVTSELGGALQRRQLEMARVQAADGHDVTILSPGDADSFEVIDGVRIEFLKLRHPRPIRDYVFLARARTRLRGRQAFDVLHVHGAPEAGWVLRNVAERCVQSVDYFQYRGSDTRLGHRYFTRRLNSFDAVLPVSDFCSTTLRRFYPGLQTTVTVLPNGVDREQFRPDPEAAALARRSLRLPEGPLVVYLGRVCEQKGSDLLGDLATSLRSSHPGVTVVAAGPPEQFGKVGRSPLMQELAAKGVVCTGAVPEEWIRGLLSAAELFVLPTRRDEMFGMAALEAASCGTAVVASNLGGIPEAVGDAGTLFETANSESFIKAVRQLLDDPNEREVLASRAAPHAERYSWRSIANEADLIYRGLLHA